MSPRKPPTRFHHYADMVFIGAMLALLMMKAFPWVLDPATREVMLGTEHPVQLYAMMIAAGGAILLAISIKCGLDHGERVRECPACQWAPPSFEEGERMAMRHLEVLRFHHWHEGEWRVFFRVVPSVAAVTMMLLGMEGWTIAPMLMLVVGVFIERRVTTRHHRLSPWCPWCPRGIWAASHA